MRITPLDIRKQPFRKTMRGFDSEQVNGFLVQVADEFEKLIEQNNALQTELVSVRTKLEGYEKIEKTLNETLITAQRATDEAKVNAQKEAELIIKDAQVRADRYEDQCRRRVSELEAEYHSLKAQRDSFLVRFKSLLRDQLALVEVLSGGMKKLDSQQEQAREGKTKAESDETMEEVPPQPDISSLFDSQ
jgi:cell division initiation protein